ncbi:MAG: hypothetical protein RR538_09720, partial [Erysipelotrichaceae bacterium]
IPMTKPKCSECDHRFKNECNAKKYETGDPYIIGPASAFDGSYGNRLQMKTSPRWCPLRGEKNGID